MPRRKVGFLGLELKEVGDGVEGEEERMKTPTPTRTWGGIVWGCLFGVVFFFFFLLRWGLGCLLVLGDGCCCCDIPAVFGNDR